MYAWIHVPFCQNHIYTDLSPSLLRTLPQSYLRGCLLDAQFSSAQFSRSVMSDSFRPHELQHVRPPYPSPTPGVHSDSCPSSQWCHPAISSSVVPFSSFLQSLPASESFPMSQLFAWGSQSPGVSALASFLPKKSQGWSPSEWTGWISLQSKGLSVLSKVKVTQSCLTLCDPIDYTVYGILQARILEWVAFTLFRGSSQPRHWTQLSHIAGRYFTSWATREAQWW